MPAHVIPQIREADDVSGMFHIMCMHCAVELPILLFSGTRIASFSSDVDGEDKLVTDTPKST